MTNQDLQRPINSSTVRIPPQAPDIELAALASMFASQEAVDYVTGIVVEKDFYKEAHQKLFKAIVSLTEKGKPVDSLTLTNELKRSKDFDLAGGAQAVNELAGMMPSVANAEYYAQIVLEKSLLRRVITAGTQIVTEAYDESLHAKEVMDKAQSRIMDATEVKGSKDFTKIGSIIGNVYERTLEISEREHDVTGVPFGFKKLDEMTQGMQPSHLILIGARPSVGKTALAFNVAWNAASGLNELGNQYRVGMFTLEMTNEELGERLLCSVSNVNFKNAKKGKLTNGEKERLLDASSKIHGAPIFLNDATGLTVLQLKAEARRLKKRENIDLIIIDYLQLLHPGIKHDNREQEIAFISRHLKALAKDLKIPILCLSQLSRNKKGEEHKRPILSDLRESGSLEQDSDEVIFIHREGDFPNFTHELIIGKQRNGPIGDIPIKFNGWSTQFQDVGDKGQVLEEEPTGDPRRQWA